MRCSRGATHTAAGDLGLRPPLLLLRLRAESTAEIELASAETGYMPQNVVKVEDKDDARRVLKLVDMLEDHDDVQNVYTNYEIADAWLDELAG